MCVSAAESDVIKSSSKKKDGDDDVIVSDSGTCSVL